MAATAGASAAAAAASSGHMPPGGVEGDVAQVQGFEQEAPQGIIMNIFDSVTRPRLEGRFSVSGWDVLWPYILFSM